MKQNTFDIEYLRIRLFRHIEVSQKKHPI